MVGLEGGAYGETKRGGSSDGSKLWMEGGRYRVQGLSVGIWGWGQALLSCTKSAIIGATCAGQMPQKVVHLKPASNFGPI